MNDVLNVALIQTELAWHDPIANCERLDGHLAAIESAVDLVVLPEMFSTGFTMSSSAMAESMQGPTLAWMRDKAAALESVVAGSVVIRDNEEVYNRLLWVRPDGSVTCYDKRHRFRMASEHVHYSAGTDRVVVEVNGFRVCLMICYDLRFPVFFRSRGDYDVLVCVANWPAERQLAWNTLLRARAIENQAYVVGVNRVGTDGSEIVYRGGSAVYDYSGDTRVEEFDAELVLMTSLDKAPLDNFRSSFPVWQDADEFEVHT